MMNEIIDHVKTNCPTVQVVENAFTTKDYPDLENGVPAIYIAPLGGQAQRSETDNFVRQVVSKQFLFQIATPANLLDDVLSELNNALLGKQIGGSYYPFQIEKEEPLDVKPNLYWYGVVYETAVIRQQA